MTILTMAAVCQFSVIKSMMMMMMMMMMMTLSKHLEKTIMMSIWLTMLLVSGRLHTRKLFASDSADSQCSDSTSRSCREDLGI